jgi:CheY-like chemotaxis protein
MKEQQVTLVAVDDDPTTLELIKEALEGLEGMDLQIHTTTDPDDALDLIQQKQADIACPGSRAART